MPNAQYHFGKSGGSVPSARPLLAERNEDALRGRLQGPTH